MILKSNKKARNDKEQYKDFSKLIKQLVNFFQKCIKSFKTNKKNHYNKYY